jgi:hypothetical protein
VGLSYSQLESGVVLAQQGAGYAEIRAALKRHDQNLELGQVAGVWKVYYRFGSEPHQIEFLCDWRDPDGTARELSQGLVDKVRSQDRNSRVPKVSAEELDRQRREKLAKHKARVIEAIDSEHQPILYRKRSAGLHVKEKPW